MESAKQAINSVVESFQGAAAGASKETNKKIAQNENADVSTRLGAAKDALKDKMNETAHNNKAEAHKNLAQNN